MAKAISVVPQWANGIACFILADLESSVFFQPFSLQFCETTNIVLSAFCSHFLARFLEGKSYGYWTNKITFEKCNQKTTRFFPIVHHRAQPQGGRAAAAKRYAGGLNLLQGQNRAQRQPAGEKIAVSVSAVLCWE
jgi:hypothetical protein